MHYNVYETDIQPILLNKEEIQKEIDTIQKTIDEQQAKIENWNEVLNYMNETGLEDYKELEFKAYKVLKTINKDTTDVEKAKLIAKIINGEL